jgi:hypothetical protein
LTVPWVEGDIFGNDLYPSTIHIRLRDHVAMSKQTDYTLTALVVRKSMV